MERPKIIILATIPRQLECVKNHFCWCFARVCSLHSVNNYSSRYVVHYLTNALAELESGSVIMDNRFNAVLTSKHD